MKLDMTYEQYEKMYRNASRDSDCIRNTVKAFVIGGSVCLLGEALLKLYSFLGMTEKTAGTAVSVSLILLSVVFTALGLYDKLARHAGAGSLVPITGFANAVAAPAIEFKTEGLITGLGVKIFTIAGPVILYGTLASAVYGVILLFV